MAEENFEEDLEREVGNRIALMEDPSYEFPEAVTKADWAWIVAVPIVCFVLLVIGEFL